MRKIDLLVVRSFIGPFLMTFLVVVLFFVLQFFYIYIDDFIGKGLKWYVVAELVLYLSANTIPIALPLAVLLSSIMTYGNLGERYELIAMKASGISLLNYMRSTFIVIVLLSLGSLAFSDQIMPTANLKFYTTLLDITQSKPAFDIDENHFYTEITNYVIKVDRKHPDNQQIYGVYIANQGSRKSNDDIIVAERGEMFSAEETKFLVLKLYNGTKYEKLPTERVNGVETRKYSITRFEEMEKVFDLSEFEMTRNNEDVFKSHYVMMNIRQLRYYMDSLKQDIAGLTQKILDLEHGYYFFLQDSSRVIEDSLGENLDYSNELITYMNEDDHEITYNRAIAFIKSIRDRIESPILLRKDSLENYILRAKIELNRKYMLAFSLIVMFLIGAPFGALIRKGGFGYPVIFAVVFFVIFFILYSVGEDMAGKRVLSPFLGIWTATIILAPVAVFFTYKALNDSPILVFENYSAFFKGIGKKLKDRFG